MALTTENLSVWTIGFRWAELDPDKVWFRIPYLVKDNFRLLMEAILSGEIVCDTLTLAKRPPDSKADPNFYIRTYIDEVYACIHGQYFNKKLLKWAELDRVNFMQWCDRRGIPYPEFWFPPGWKLEFDMPEGGTPAMWAEHVEPTSEGQLCNIHYDVPDIDSNITNDKHYENEDSLRRNQTIRIACQQIALEIWKDEPDRTIASIVKDDLVQKYGGACHYQDDTVRGWIKKVAPVSVSQKRGRPRKNSDEDDS